MAWSETSTGDFIESKATLCKPSFLGSVPLPNENTLPWTSYEEAANRSWGSALLNGEPLSPNEASTLSMSERVISQRKAAQPRAAKLVATSTTQATQVPAQILQSTYSERPSGGLACLSPGFLDHFPGRYRFGRDPREVPVPGTDAGRQRGGMGPGPVLPGSAGGGSLRDDGRGGDG